MNDEIILAEVKGYLSAETYNNLSKQYKQLISMLSEEQQRTLNILLIKFKVAGLREGKLLQ